MSFYQLGTVHEKLKKSKDALAYYQQALAIAETLAAKDKSDKQAQDDLAKMRLRVNQVDKEIRKFSEKSANKQKPLKDAILPTGIICAFVKRLCKPFFPQNDLQNRFTENSESTHYDGGKNNLYLLKQKPLKDADSYLLKQKPLKDANLYLLKQKPLKDVDSYLLKQKPLKDVDSYLLKQKPLKDANLYLLKQKPLEEKKDADSYLLKEKPLMEKKDADSYLLKLKPLSIRIVDTNISGEWRGSYEYPSNSDMPPVPFQMKIFQEKDKLHGSITEHKNFGHHSTPSLSATFKGSINKEGKVSFIKQYDGQGDVAHNVNYDGRLSENGKMIKGTWSISGDCSGTFEMHTEKSQPLIYVQVRGLRPGICKSPDT